MKIKRIMLCFGTVFCISVLFSLFAKNNILIAISAAFSAVGIYFLLGKNSKKLIAFISVLTLGIISVLNFNICIRLPFSKLYGKKIPIKGVIINQIHFDKCTLLKCRATIPNSKGIPKSFLCDLWCYSDNCGDEGDCFSAVVKVSLNEKSKINENFSNGVYLTGTVENYKHLSFENIFILQRTAIKIKNYIKNNIYEFMSGNSADLAFSMVTGEKCYIDKKIKNNFRRSGIIHITAVSGLHTAIFSEAVMLSLKFIKINKRLGSIITIPLIWIYAFVCGLSPSTVRSALMISLSLIGNIVFRKADTLNSLGFAALISVSVNPFILLNSGFELSYSAVFGIAFLAPKLIHYFKFKHRFLNTYIRNILFYSISAWLFTLPICALRFGYFSVLSFLTNILIAYIVPVFLVISFFIGILPSASLLIKTKYILAIISNSLGKTIINISSRISSLSFAAYEITDNYENIMIILLIILFATAILKFRSPSVRKAFILCSFFIFIISKFSCFIINYDSSDIISYKDCTVFIHNKDAVIISDLNIENSLCFAKINNKTKAEFRKLNELENYAVAENFSNLNKKLHTDKNPDSAFYPEINMEYSTDGYYKIKINDIFILKKFNSCDIINEKDYCDIVIDEFGNIFFKNLKLNNIFSENHNTGNHIKIYRSNFA